MKSLYDFLPEEEREWVERCQFLSIVILVAVLAMLGGFAFAGDSGGSTDHGTATTAADQRAAA
jgi:hypothetical protein